MLTGITLASCAVDAQDRYLAALSGVAFLDTTSGLQVVAASAGENAITRFAFDTSLREIEVLRLPAHAGLHDIARTQTGLIALARWDNSVLIDETSLSAAGPAGLLAQAGSATSTLNSAGLKLDTVTIADSATLPLGDVTALAMLEDGRILAGSAFDTGVALISAQGMIHDVALAGDGFWHNRVSAIETVGIGGRDFAIVAASGSSSLSVFEVLGDELILTDHEWDNMFTRFSGVTELATVQLGGMTVVAAGGSDAGLSLFELTAEGDLVHLETIVDTAEITLNGVTGLDMIATGDGAVLVVASERDHGLSLFELEFEFAPDPDPADVVAPAPRPYFEAIPPWPTAYREGAAPLTAAPAPFPADPGSAVEEMGLLDSILQADFIM